MPQHSNPRNVANDEDEDPLDNQLSHCHKICIGELAFGALNLVSFWATYWWTIAFGVMCVIVGVCGAVAFRTVREFAKGMCCMKTKTVISAMTMSQIAIIVLGILCMISSIIGTVEARNDEVAKGFAITSIVVAVMLIIIASFGIKCFSTLKKIAKSDERVFPPEPKFVPVVAGLGGGLRGNLYGEHNVAAAPTACSGSNPCVEIQQIYIPYGKSGAYSNAAAKEDCLPPATHTGNAASKQQQPAVIVVNNEPVVATSAQPQQPMYVSSEGYLFYADPPLKPAQPSTTNPVAALPPLPQVVLSGHQQPQTKHNHNIYYEPTHQIVDEGQQQDENRIPSHYNHQYNQNRGKPQNPFNSKNGDCCDENDPFYSNQQPAQQRRYVTKVLDPNVDPQLQGRRVAAPRVRPM